LEDHCLRPVVVRPVKHLFPPRHSSAVPVDLVTSITLECGPARIARATLLGLEVFERRHAYRYVVAGGDDTKPVLR